MDQVTGFCAVESKKPQRMAEAFCSVLMVPRDGIEPPTLTGDRKTRIKSVLLGGHGGKVKPVCVPEAIGLWVLQHEPGIQCMEELKGVHIRHVKVFANIGDNKLPLRFKI